MTQEPIAGNAYVVLFKSTLTNRQWKHLRKNYGLVLAVPTRNPTLPSETVYMPFDGSNAYEPPRGSGGNFTKVAPFDCTPEYWGDGREMSAD